MELEQLPLLLPDITIDGLKVKDWQLTIRTFNFGKPYLVYRYESPDNKEYVFHSRSIDELVDYLKEYKLI